MENDAALERPKTACPEAKLNGDAELDAIDAAMSESLRKLEKAISELKVFIAGHDEKGNTSELPSSLFYQG